MPIETIDAGLCTGCGTCELSCPMDVIHMDQETGKAAVLYALDCTACGACAADCGEGAIAFSPTRTVQPLTAW